MYLEVLSISIGVIMISSVYNVRFTCYLQESNYLCDPLATFTSRSKFVNLNRVHGNHCCGKYSRRKICFEEKAR
jgi:hypothetical protein